MIFKNSIKIKKWNVYILKSYIFSVQISPLFLDYIYIFVVVNVTCDIGIFLCNVSSQTSRKWKALIITGSSPGSERSSGGGTGYPLP